MVAELRWLALQSAPDIKSYQIRNLWNLSDATPVRVEANQTSKSILFTNNTEQVQWQADFALQYPALTDGLRTRIRTFSRRPSSGSFPQSFAMDTEISYAAQARKSILCWASGETYANAVALNAGLAHSPSTLNVTLVVRHNRTTQPFSLMQTVRLAYTDSENDIKIVAYNSSVKSGRGLRGIQVNVTLPNGVIARLDTWYGFPESRRFEGHVSASLDEARSTVHFSADGYRKELLGTLEFIPRGTNFYIKSLNWLT